MPYFTFFGRLLFEKQTFGFEVLKSAHSFLANNLLAVCRCFWVELFISGKVHPAGGSNSTERMLSYLKIHDRTVCEADIIDSK